MLDFVPLVLFLVLDFVPLVLCFFLDLSVRLRLLMQKYELS